MCIEHYLKIHRKNEEKDKKGNAQKRLTLLNK